MSSGYLVGISGRVEALREAPGVKDGSCTTLGGGWGRMNQRDLTGDIFLVIVPLLTYESSG